MRIISTIFGGVTATLISIFGAGTNEKEIPKEGPPPLTRSFPEKSAPVPHPFLVAQLQQPKETLPAPQIEKPVPNYLITLAQREDAQNNPASPSAFEIVQSPAYTITEKDIEIALKNENSWFAAGAGKNTTTNPILFKELLERALKNRNSKLTYGVFQNQNEALFKVTDKLKKEYIEKAKNGSVNENEAVIAKHHTWEFTDVERELAIKSSSPYFRYWAAQNPSFFKGLNEKQAKEYRSRATCNGEIWLSEGLTQNTGDELTNNGFEFTAEDLKALRAQLQSWAAHGAGRSKNYPWGPVDHVLMLSSPNSYLQRGKTQSPFYNGLYNYSFLPPDREFARKFHRTHLAYTLNIDPLSPAGEENTEFARKSHLNANSAYAIGQVRNPKFNPGNKEIQWILESEINASTELAYEVGLKLNYEQIREYFDVSLNQKSERMSVKEAVRSYLVDTLFAKAVSKNPNFAEVNQFNGSIYIPETDKHFIQGDQQQGGRASYAFTKLAAGLIQNLYYGEIEPADVSIAQREFIRDSDFAYHLAKKLDEKQILKIKDLDDFIIKNPKSKFVIGLFNNESYKPSDKVLKFLFENSKSNFVRELAKSKAFKITPEIKKIVFQNPDDELAYGATQNESWGIVSPEEKRWIFEKGNHNTLAARGLLMNIKCYKMGDAKIEKEFLKKDEKNLNTMIADLIGAHPEFILDYEFSEIAREKPTHFTRGIRNNPQANATALYVPERERR